MRKKIKNFSDLEVYQRAYAGSIKIGKEILPKIPKKEKYDLVDQLSRASKAIPRLIAEGYAKKHQRAGFQKYLDDALAECNETIVCLSHCRDIYRIKCNNLIKEYDISARQIFKLAEAWGMFKNARRSEKSE